MSAGLGGWQMPEPQPIGRIAQRLLREKRFHQKGKYGPLAASWVTLVGAPVAGHTQIRSFAGGELVVEVDSSPLLHELNNFLKGQLLAAMKETPGGRDLASLRFVLTRGPAQPGPERT